MSSSHKKKFGEGSKLASTVKAFSTERVSQRKHQTYKKQRDQTQVLGPLFFLLMINDLAYIIELMCKLFADDTTLGDVDMDLNILINRFVSKLKTLLELCQFNKLDIN